jgi:hypothetical protein
MFVGVSDDSFEWNTTAMAATARDLGLRAIRVSLTWRSGETALTSGDRAALGKVIDGDPGMRIVLSAFNQGDPPLDDADRQQYCSYVGDAITKFPQINDVVIWNEPNLSGFWRPQFGPPGQTAPEQYEQLIATCYDYLHSLRSSVNVIGPATSLWGNDNPNAFDNISHSPTTFIEDLGAAYRASGRTAPLFDTLGHHPYPGSSNERPWTVHSDPAVISLGDLPRLLSTMQTAFGGTGQPIPQTGLPIWYLETGYQTTIPASKAAFYFGVENWPGAIPDIVSPEPPDVSPPDTSPAPDQATQLTDELRLTYCQPYIQADFNFMLEDEQSLGGWQSGLLWADGTRKGSYGAFKSAVAEVNSGNVDCSTVAGAPLVTAAPPIRTSVTVSATPAPPKKKAPPPRKRSLTKVTFVGAKVAPYGFLSFRARLTVGLEASKNVLKGRRLVFRVGKTVYNAYTNRAGYAQVSPNLPLPLGKHRVAIRFHGDKLHLGSGIRIDTVVVNSPGTVASKGVLKLSGRRSLAISATSHGGAARGLLTVREPGIKRAVSIRELGVRSDNTSAWLRGSDGAGRRYVMHVERVAGRKVHIEVGGALTLSATVPARRVALARH